MHTDYYIRQRNFFAFFSLFTIKLSFLKPNRTKKKCIEISPTLFWADNNYTINFWINWFFTLFLPRCMAFLPLLLTEAVRSFTLLFFYHIRFCTVLLQTRCQIDDDEHKSIIINRYQDRGAAGAQLLSSFVYVVRTIYFVTSNFVMDIFLRKINTACLSPLIIEHSTTCTNNTKFTSKLDHVVLCTRMDEKRGGGMCDLKII